MYRYTVTGSILREVDGATIPIEPLNVDYMAVMDWVSSGNEIAPSSRGLAGEKAFYSRQLDEDAENVRLRYITPGAGMAMTYQEKFAQAQAVAAMDESVANAMSEADRIEQFPTLAASVGIEAATIYACAQLVLTRYAAFAALSYQIERVRLAGKAAILAASTVQGVREAYEAAAWPTQ